MHYLALLAPFAVLASPVLAASPVGQVHVVDAAGGGDFVTLQAAIDASSDGDILLVKSGTYTAFTIDDSAVTIVADRQATVSIERRALVRDLDGARTVVLSGLRIDHGGSPFDVGALVLEHCDGPVRIQECTSIGYDGLPGDHDKGTQPEDATDGARVVDCLDVLFTACDLRGGNGGGELEEFQGGTLPSGAEGIDAETTSLAVFRTLLFGGNGGEDFSATACGGSGGAGLTLYQSSFYAIHSVFQGGDGRDGWDVIPCCGEGGPGANVTDSQATEFSSALYGGIAGCWIFDQAGECSCSDGPPFWGSIDSQPGQARAALMPRIVREGETYTIDYYGRVGDVVYHMESGATAATHMKPWHGVLVFPRPFALTLVGTIPASGLLSVTHVEGSLPPGAEGRVIHRQALFRSTPGGGAFLSNPSTLVVLDSTF